MTYPTNSPAKREITPQDLPARPLCKLAVAACAFFGMSAHALAVDVNSTDYVPAPVGTNVLALYSTYTTRGSYETLHGGQISGATGLDSMVEIVRLIHYMDFFGFTLAPQILVPFGSLYNGELGGVNLKSATGFADPILAAPLWLVNNAKTGSFFAITPYLFIPVGSSDPNQALNLGENRWKFDLQAGYAQKLGDSFMLQLTGDVMWYGANNYTAANVPYKLTQDTTYQFQAWLSYSPAADATWRFAVGYSQFWGGEQQLDGTSNGAATQASQVRLEVSKFVAPDFQVLGLVQTDVAASGGFKEDFRGTIRLLKVL